MTVTLRDSTRSSSGNAFARVMFGNVGLDVTVTPCLSVDPADQPM